MHACHFTQVVTVSPDTFALLRHASPETVCGAVRNIARDGEEMHVMTLGELREYKADMFNTVFVGNSQTRVIDGKMVTPRGYRNA